jgi:hypothetical protein
MAKSPSEHVEVVGTRISWSTKPLAERAETISTNAPFLTHRLRHPGILECVLPTSSIPRVCRYNGDADLMSVAFFLYPNYLHVRQVIRVSLTVQADLESNGLHGTMLPNDDRTITSLF